MKHIAQNSFEDDNLGNEDIDRVFSRLDQRNPPEDFVERLMQAISRLPLPSNDEHVWDSEDPIVHHGHKQSS